MLLVSNPVRISKGVPVLRYGKRYRFKGRLTCLVNGKRRSAPKGTRIELLNTARGRTVSRVRTEVGVSGAIALRLSYRRARTLVFRYRAADGTTAQVRIKVRVTRKGVRH